MHRWVKQQMGLARQERVRLPDELVHHLQDRDCKLRFCHRLLGLYIRVAINFLVSIYFACRLLVSMII